jgi:hypothetical protein
MRIDWKAFKKFLDDTELYNFLNYMELADNFYVWMTYQGETFNVTLEKATVDCEDFVNNYKSKAILKSDIANDGQSVTKITHVLYGRFLKDVFVKIKTSTKENNDVTGLFTVRLFDELNHETDISANVVKTAIDFCPNFTYEIFGGGLESIDNLNSEFYVSAVIAPDIPSQQGGSLYYLINRYMLQPKQNVFVSGVGTAEVGYNSQMPIASKLRIAINHDKGIQQNFQVELQYYA